MTMPRNILTVASRKRLESRKRLTPFRKNSRVMNQFKPKQWPTVRQWIVKYQNSGLLTLCEDETPQTATRLQFNHMSHARHGRGVFTKGDVYQALVELICQVGRKEGLVYNEMVFYRYITSPEHSNLNVNYKSLKRQFSSMISEYLSGEK